MTSPDVLEAAAPWLTLCGFHDAGMPMGCCCPQGDPRAVIRQMADEIGRLRALTGHGLTVEEWEGLADELGRTYEFSSGPGNFVGWLAYRHHNEQTNVKLLRKVVERLETQLAEARGLAGGSR